MAKSTTYIPFEGVVCERMRRLAAKIDRWEAQREKAFKARDAADAGLNEIGASESKKRTELLSDFGDSVRKIKDLDHKLRDAIKAIAETLRYADQAELFDDPDTFNAPSDDEASEGEEQAELKDARPVGRIGAGA